MACCYIAAFMIGQLVKACQFLDMGDGIKYNEEKESKEDLWKPSAKEVPGAPRTYSSGNKACLIISLGGLTCSACTDAVASAVKALPGVSKVRASLTMQQATVVAHNNVPLDHDKILKVIEDLGYEASIGPRAPKEVLNMLEHKQKIANLGATCSRFTQCAVLLQALAWGRHLAPGSSTPSRVFQGFLDVASIFVMIYVQFSPAYEIHRDGRKWWRTGRLNMDTLTSLAMCLGTALPLLEYVARGRYGHHPDYTMAVRLGLVVVAGKYVDNLSRRAAAKDIGAVYKPILETDTATLYPEMQVVPSAYLQPGDKILLEPHTIVPCDCYVLEGTSLVGMSIVTGESLPVKKTVGNFLLGGTRNLNSRLICAVQKEKGESFYKNLVQSALETASTSSSDNQWVDTIARYFVLSVIGISLATALSQAYSSIGALPLIDIIHASMLRMVTILTCACPCALSMAIPSATVAAVVAACGRGILLTGGIDTIDKLSQSHCVLFDKTGTLTHARLDVGDFLVSDDSPWSKSTLWEYACALESQVVTDHPIARAIFSSGLKELGSRWTDGQHLRAHRNVEPAMGRGVKGDVQLPKLPWCEVVIGSARFLADCGYTLTRVPAVNTEGMIVVHMGVGKQYAGTFMITDVIRDEARDVVQSLIADGIRCGMTSMTKLTGDTEEAAARVSRQLGLPITRARALPGAKQDCIKNLQDKGYIVTMVGDGLNDAPSLATADVGINFRKNAASATISGAVTIVNSRLSSLPALYSMARVTMDQVRFNLYWIFAYNAVALALATEVITPFGMRLSPSFAAFLMSFSSIFLSFQSSRLKTRLERVSQSPYSV